MPTRCPTTSTTTRGDRGSSYTSTSPVDDPEQAAITDDRRRAVLAALATLPAEQRAALVLVDMEGYPVSEVAVMLDCAEGTVKSRCSRGRERLAGLLRDRLDDRSDEPGRRRVSEVTRNPSRVPPVRSPRPPAPRPPPAKEVHRDRRA